MSQSSLVKDNGLSYFLKGLSLITKPGLRLFVIIPLLANVLIFGIGFALLLQQFDALLNWLTPSTEGWPSILSWFMEAIMWLFWPLAISATLLVFGFTFSIVGNWIAAPFMGLLAEKVEQHLSGQNLGDTSISDVLKDVPRILLREWKKFLYWLPKALGILLLFFLPPVGQILWIVFGAWMMAVQYIDYPFDNHKVPFHQMRDKLKQHRIRNGSFGGLVMLCSSIPVLNLLVMPVAVCAATAIWVDHYRDEYLKDEV